MEFRIFKEKDLHKCVETFIDVCDDEPWNDEWTFEQGQQYLSDFYHTPGFLGILAVENQEIIGYILGVSRIWWSGDEFYIHEMGVKKQQQGLGIGSTLLNQLAKKMAESNISNLSLLTDRGVPAEEFYKKNGFKEIERLMFLSKDTNDE